MSSANKRNSTCAAHTLADLRQSGRVVNAIADHGNGSALTLQSSNLGGLPVGQKMGITAAINVALRANPVTPAGNLTPVTNS